MIKTILVVVLIAGAFACALRPVPIPMTVKPGSVAQLDWLRARGYICHRHGAEYVCVKDDWSN